MLGFKRKGEREREGGKKREREIKEPLLMGFRCSSSQSWPGPERHTEGQGISKSCPTFNSAQSRKA
jgi:hypothetical protein